MIKTNVHIDDSGMKAFADNVKKLRGRVDIGVFGESDSDQVIIAATQEFGTDRAGKNHNVTIPQRSFLRSTLDEEKDEIRDRVDDAKVDVITGKISKKKFLARLGLWFENKVKAKIQAGGDPFIENAPSTAQAKKERGRSRPIPLNDQGRLRQSIASKVNE
jgi:phage gpG-like protein